MGAEGQATPRWEPVSGWRPLCRATLLACVSEFHGQHPSKISVFTDSTEEFLESNDILGPSLTSQGSQEIRVHSSDVGRTSWALTEHAPTALWVTVLHWSTALFFLAFEDWDQISVFPTEKSKSTFLSTGAFLQNLLKWAGCPLPLLPPLVGLNTDTNSEDLAHRVASSVTPVQPS